MSPATNDERKRYKLIACEVFVRSASLAVATSPHTVDPVFTPKAAHAEAEKLRNTVQELIDEADATGLYDAIVLGLGLCGNGLVGVRAGTTTLVLPRAHDCCTLFLGSKERFHEHFGENLSATWASPGYMERGDEYLRESDVGKALGLDSEYEQLVEQYGEENAAYVWETLHPPINQTEITFIEDPDITDDSFRQSVEDDAKTKGLAFRLLPGDMRLIRQLIHGEWNDDEFLTVPPGAAIQGLYDRDRIVEAAE